MQVRKFQAKDFETYQSWFSDELLNRHLGPAPDDEWLNHVLTDMEGIQYAFFEKDELVGVIGIVFPGKAHPNYYITDIAVRPILRKKGIGAKMLMLLQNLHPSQPQQVYIAFVDIKNKNAQLFFKKLGWHLVTELPDKDEMLTFKSK